MKPKHISVLLTTALCLISACWNNSEKVSEYEKREKEAKAQFISRFSHLNPIIFTPDAFSNKKIFTYTLQKLLLDEDGRPVVFDGYLDDITKVEKQFIIHFTGVIGNDESDGRRIRFHLKCDYEDVKQLIENPPEYDPLLYDLRFLNKDFLIICKVLDVKKIVTYNTHKFLSSYPSYPGDDSGDVFEVETGPPDVFSVNGDLIEMVKYINIGKTAQVSDSP